MGLAASQVRLLQLTQRGNNVRCELTRLSMQKMRLSADRSKASRAYQEALSAKTLKWTDNSGASYIDLSYSNLMYPKGSYNNNNLYLITDLDGRVVVDTKYRQLAKIISPDGKPGANWESKRDQILPQLIGLTPSEIQDAEDFYDIYLDKQMELDEILASKPEKPAKAKHTKTSDLLKLAGSYGGMSDLGSAYDSSTEVNKDSIDGLLEHLKCLKRYFPGTESLYEKAIDNLKGSMTCNMTMSGIVNQIIAAYQNNGGPCSSNTYDGKTNFIWYDVDCTDYKQYQQDYAAWEALKESTANDMNSALDSFNNIESADVKSMVDFYDKLFSSIAENGWVCNGSVSNSEYLNQMFQNGLFNITTVERDYDSSKHKYTNTYNTELALNSPHIIQVSDADARDDALVKYEHEKDLINAKETRIDTRMKNLETEQSAIKQMIESVNNTMKNNIEQNMNIFA